jgi:hypothetical protein
VVEHARHFGEKLIVQRAALKTREHPQQLRPELSGLIILGAGQSAFPIF